MSTTLLQLRVERVLLLKLLKDLKRQAEHGTTNESIDTMLYNEYEAKLIRVERDISHHELHQDREHIATKQPANEEVQPTQNPPIIKIETTHTYIQKPILSRTKKIRVIQSQKNSDS